MSFRSKTPLRLTFGLTFSMIGFIFLSRNAAADETKPSEARGITSPKKSIELKVAAFETTALLSSWHHLGVTVPENFVAPKKISEFSGPFGNTYDVVLKIEHLAIKHLVVVGADKPVTTPLGTLQYDLDLNFDEIKVETKILIQFGPKKVVIFQTPVNVALQDLRLPMTLSATDTKETMDVRPLELRQQDIKIFWPVIPKWANKILNVAGFYNDYKSQIHTALMKELPNAILGDNGSTPENKKDD